MQRNRIFKKAISIVCMVAMLVTAFYQPGLTMRSSAAEPMKTTTTLTELTWDSYVKNEEGSSWVKGSYVNNLHSEEGINNTLFNDEIRFSANGQWIRYGGADGTTSNAPIEIGINNNKIYVSSGNGTGFAINEAYEGEPSYFGLPSFLNTPLNLKIEVTNLNETKNQATVRVWINDRVVRDSFTVSSDAYTIGSNIVGNGEVTRDDNTLPPTNLTELTWESYVKNEAGSSWTKGSYVNNLHSEVGINNTLFNDEIRFSNNGQYIRYGGADNSTWNAPIEIGINNNKIYVSSGNGTGFAINEAYEGEPSYFGLPSFLNTPLNLKIEVTNLNETKNQATVRVWINDRIVRDSFTVSSDAYTIGSNIVGDGEVTRDDNTLPPTNLTELTWDSYVKNEAGSSWVKGSYVNNLHSEEGINNTLFNDEIRFSANGQWIRYGGADESTSNAPIEIGINNNKIYVSSGNGTGFAINEAYEGETSYFGLPSFLNTPLNLKIEVTNLNETKNQAAVRVWINDRIVKDSFAVSSDTYTIGNNIVGNGEVTRDDNTLPPVISDIPSTTSITWSDFAGVVYGSPYSSWTDFTYNNSSLQYTELTGRAMFEAGGTLRIGGGYGLHIGAKTDGKLYVSSHTFARLDYETGADWSYDEEPATYGIDTFVNTPVDIKVNIGKISADSKKIEKVELFINDVQVGKAFSMVASGDTPFGNQLSLACNDYGDQAGKVMVLSNVSVPEDKSLVSWEDFGITGSYTYNKSESGRTAHHYPNLNNTLFDGDVKMAAGAHFRYGCDNKEWSGLQFTAQSDGSLLINSDTFNWDNKEKYTFTPTQFGLTSFVNERFNLKIEMTDVTVTSAKVGVWINNQMAGKYFTMISGDARAYKLGTTIWWATTAYDITPYSSGRTYDADSLTDVRLSDWATEDLGTELSDLEINSAPHNKVDSLIGTSFCETLKFIAPTPETEDAYMFCYGGMQDEGTTWMGLRIALVKDQMVLYGVKASFTDKWYLNAHTAGIKAFADTEYQLRIDTVQLGEHVLVYMYFNGVLYNNAPFVLEDFASFMGNTLVFTTTKENTYVILGPGKRTLSDLYHDLEAEEGKTSGYVSGDNTFKEAGKQEIEFNDGVSDYAQTVYLYRAGDVNMNDSLDVMDLVRIKKYAGNPEEVTGVDVKTADANKDGSVDKQDAADMRKRLVGSYQPDTSSVMPIVGFYGPIDNSDGTEATASMNTVKEEVYDMIKELGINTIVQYQNQYTDIAADRYEVYEQLTLAQNIGVKMTVQDHRLGSKASTVTADDVKNAIANYKNFQSFAGLYITDEPRSATYPPKNSSSNTISAFENLAKVAKQAGVWTYSNAKGYMYKEVNNKTASYAYKNYLTEYMDAFELDFLSTTYYPFFTYEINNGSIGNGVDDASQYFENLALVSAVAKDVPFWRVIQSGDGFEQSDREDNNPSEGEFRWNVNTSLAFGAKGITYFQLVQDQTSYEVSKSSTTSGLIGATGEKNQWYDYAKEANAQIQAVDDVLMNATYQGFMAYGTKASNATNGIAPMSLYDSKSLLASAKETISMNKLWSYNDASVTSNDGTYGVVTGCFTGKDGENILYVVNYNVTDNSTVTVNLGSQKEVTYVQNAESHTVQTKSLELNLRAGEAAMVTFK